MIANLHCETDMLFSTDNKGSWNGAAGGEVAYKQS